VVKVSQYFVVFQMFEHVLTNYVCRLGRTTRHSIGTTTILMPHKWPSWMCQIPSQTLCRRMPLIQRNKITTRPSNSPRRPQITRTLGLQMGHEIQRKEMLHNEHETEIELLLPTRSAHSLKRAALFCMLSNLSIFLLVYGSHIKHPYSRVDLTVELN
jgi:hypothetical protein